jgi:hypothetical protein
MSYETQDVSVHDGQPIECFEFVGTLTTYRFCNGPEDVMVDGLTYIPLNIERTAIEIGSILEANVTMDFIVPYDCPLAMEYGGEETPENLEVRVIRIHRGGDWTTDFEVIWNGTALGYSRSGDIFSISTGSTIQAELLSTIASVYYQTTCNHVLYDARCKVNKAANTTSALITLVGDTAVTVDNDGVADDQLNAGEIVNTRTGERRMVLRNLANVITIGYPFIDAVPGDTVSLVKGCSHAFSECKLKFNNILNYGGFMYVPDANPWVEGI